MNLLEDKHGLPWTAHIGPVWMTLFVILTLGTGPVLLAVYLALWAGSRRGAWLPLACILSFTAIAVSSYTAVEYAILSGIMDALVLIAPFLWIGGNFLLREEILKDAEERGIPCHIGKLLTFVLSSLYLNFCLRPGTSPVPEQSLAPLKL